jgi:hypothetical protein
MSPGGGENFLRNFESVDYSRQTLANQKKLFLTTLMTLKMLFDFYTLR